MSLRKIFCSSLLTVSLFTFAAISANAVESKSNAEEGKAVELIKNDLSGWIVDGNKTLEVDGKEIPVWSIKDGAIHCAGVGKSRGFLRYDKKVDDFELHIEYKISQGCNSGIGLRTVTYTGSRKTRPSRAGYEVQILDDKHVDLSQYKKNQRNMSLYRHISRAEDAQKPAGKWNVVDIRCQGPNIRVVLNGKEMHNIDQRDFESLKNKSTSGYICFQDHGHEIDFRNVRLKRLAKSKNKVTK